MVGPYASFTRRLKLKSSKQACRFAKLTRKLSLLVTHRPLGGFECNANASASPVSSFSSGINADVEGGRGGRVIQCRCRCLIALPHLPPDHQSELIRKQVDDHTNVVEVYASFVRLFVELTRNLSLLVAHRLNPLRQRTKRSSEDLSAMSMQMPHMPLLPSTPI
ncbi:hypothetical protein GW17_00020398 [Ensete ventricosum]|nr:hypothetical protein GW17_00020398 [Ensete ventricosum]